MQSGTKQHHFVYPNKHHQLITSLILYLLACPEVACGRSTVRATFMLTVRNIIFHQCSPLLCSLTQRTHVVTFVLGQHHKKCTVLVSLYYILRGATELGPRRFGGARGRVQGSGQRRRRPGGPGVPTRAGEREGQSFGGSAAHALLSATSDRLRQRRGQVRERES